jgi:hypothetical protein
VAVVGGDSEDDIELGSEFSGFGIRDRFERDHEVLDWFSEALDEAVFCVSLIARDEALGGEVAFVISVDGEVDVRSARSVGNGLDGAEIVTSIAAGHEASKALEVVVALWPGQATVLAVDVGALVVDLPDFNAGIGDGIAFYIGDLAMKVGDGSDSGIDGIVDAQQVVVGIEGKLVRVKRALGHRGSDGERFGKGSGDGEECGGAEGGSAEEVAAMKICIHIERSLSRSGFFLKEEDYPGR